MEILWPIGYGKSSCAGVATAAFGYAMDWTTYMNDDERNWLEITNDESHSSQQETPRRTVADD